MKTKHSLELIMRIIYSCTAIFIVLAPFAAFSATESELRTRIENRNKEIAALEQEIAAYQKTLEHTVEKSKTLQGEVSRVETQIKKLNSDIRLTENRIAAAELHIEDLNGAIEEKERSAKLQRSALAKTIQTVYEQDTDSLLEVLLQNERLSDFFGHVEDIHRLEQSIYDELQNLRGIKIVLEEERASRVERKEELSKLTSELGYRRAIEEDVRQEKKTLLTRTKNEEVRYQQLVAERAEKREEMLDEIQSIEDKLRALIDPSSIPEANEGVLAWPLKNVTLTQSFGITPDSKILYNGKPHNGIDLQASVGTPIYAADSGIVKEIGNTDAFPGCLSYGKWLIIEHTNNLATLYAHLSQISIRKGTSISRGDIVGYTGATGYATGPHLHFTVYDASTVQFRSSKIPGSNCQFLPYGGYLNPLAYL